MNKTDFQDWKRHPITKHLLADIDEEVERVKSSSNIRDTIDQTGMQTVYSEGFCSGRSELQKAMDTLELNLESGEEVESNED